MPLSAVRLSSRSLIDRPFDMLEQISVKIDKYDLFQAGQPVIVRVSGGPDLLTLLYVLTRLRDELQIQLHVGHLDHVLRPGVSGGHANRR